MKEYRSRTKSPQSNFSMSSNEFGPSYSITREPSDSGPGSDGVIPISSFGDTQPSAVGFRSPFHDSRSTFADSRFSCHESIIETVQPAFEETRASLETGSPLSNPMPHFNDIRSSSSDSRSKSSFDDSLNSSDLKQGPPSARSD